MSSTVLHADPPADRLRAALHSVTEAAMRQTGAEAGAICLIDVEANELRFVGGIGLDPSSTLTPGQRIPLHTTMIGRSALLAEPSIIDDVTRLSAYEGEFRARIPGIRALLWLPLKTHDQVIGVLALGDSRPGYFRDEPLAALAGLISQAALAIENASLYESAERRLAQLASMYQVAQALSASIDMQPVIEAIVRVATEHSSFPSAALALLQPRTLLVDFVASVNVPESFRKSLTGFPINAPPLRGSVLHLVMSTKGPAVVQDVSAEMTPGPGRAAMLEAGLLASVCIPLVAKGRFEGALFVYDTRPRPDAVNELPLLSALADQAAVAIANARLYEEMDESLRQTRALQRLTSAVAGSLDLQETLDHALNAAAQLFGTDRAAIYMQNPTTRQMNPVAARGLSQDYLTAVRERYETPEGTSTPELPADYRYIADATTDPRMGPLRDAATREGFRSMLFVSLRYRGELRGVFVLYHNEVRTYSETEIGLARTFGEQAAIAIEHARLFEESRRLAVVDERNRLARELHDSVTQSLFSISLITRALPELMDRDASRARERVERLTELAGGALAEMRSLIFELRPAALEQEGLVSAITKFAAAFESREGVTVSIAIARERRLPLDQEEALFRIAQEALNNVAKHAQAAAVTIELNFDDGCTALLVRDNGIGFDPAAQPAGRRGFGMTSMRERATLAGAALELRSAPGAGTEIRVTLPCSGEPPPAAG